MAGKEFEPVFQPRNTGQPLMPNSENAISALNRNIRYSRYMKRLFPAWHYKKIWRVQFEF